MSGHGKGGKAKGKAKSRSSHAGLEFPVGRIHCLLCKGIYAQRVGAGAPRNSGRIAPFFLAHQGCQGGGNAYRNIQDSEG